MSNVRAWQGSVVCWSAEFWSWSRHGDVLLSCLDFTHQLLRSDYHKLRSRWTSKQYCETDSCPGIAWAGPCCWVLLGLPAAMAERISVTYCNICPLRSQINNAHFINDISSGRSSTRLHAPPGGGNSMGTSFGWGNEPAAVRFVLPCSLPPHMSNCISRRCLDCYTHLHKEQSSHPTSVTTGPKAAAAAAAVIGARPSRPQGWICRQPHWRWCGRQWEYVRQQRPQGWLRRHWSPRNQGRAGSWRQEQWKHPWLELDSIFCFDTFVNFFFIICSKLTHHDTVSTHRENCFHSGTNYIIE